VLSVLDATKLITDGQLVTVDGEKGIVSVGG
jgi:phosphohistidine swiveling domain-containing protein